MYILAILAVLLTSAVISGSPTPTEWAENWQSEFTETIWYFMQGNLTTTGQFKYVNNETHRLTRVSRENGRSDRYCGSIFPFSTTPCDNLVLNGFRYLIFSEKKYCCKCCSSAEGCGIVKRNWTQGATYIGEQQVSNLQTQMFVVKGLQNNFYAETVDSHQPKRIYQEPISDMIFKEGTYKEGALTADDFKLPTDYGNCDNACPLLSLCSLVKFT